MRPKKTLSSWLTNRYQLIILRCSARTISHYPGYSGATNTKSISRYEEVVRHTDLRVSSVADPVYLDNSEGTVELEEEVTLLEY